MEQRDWYEPAPGTVIVRVYRDGSWLEEREGQRTHRDWGLQFSQMVPQRTTYQPADLAQAWAPSWAAGIGWW